MSDEKSIKNLKTQITKSWKKSVKLEELSTYVIKENIEALCSDFKALKELYLKLDLQGVEITQDSTNVDRTLFF